MDINQKYIYFQYMIWTKTIYLLLTYIIFIGIDKLIKIPLWKLFNTYMEETLSYLISEMWTFTVKQTI